MTQLPQPSLLGLEPSFGFGDRLGLALVAGPPSLMEGDAALGPRSDLLAAALDLRVELGEQRLVHLAELVAAMPPK